MKKKNIGADYNTDWARTPLARKIRGFLMKFFARPAARLVAPTDIEGIDRIENLDGPVIFAANHSSHLDTTLILSVLPEHFRDRAVVAAGADYFFDRKLKAAWWALSIGAIPVERTKVTRKSAAQLEDLLKQNYSVLIFPEGGRTPDGWMHEFRAGAAFLAERTGVPVVPMYLEGTRKVWKKGSHRITPHRVSVTFGKPMSIESGGDIRAFSKQLENAVAALADETHTDWWSATKRSARGETPDLRGPEVSSWRRAWALATEQPKNKKRPWPNA